MKRNNPHAEGNEARHVAQRVLDHDEAGPSHSGANEEVRDIFLSHSGKQKRFVEHLYDALQRANHSVFLDKHSLPIGEPFPDYIKRAAQGCKLGVVVLSHDFLSTKWPMLELEILVLQRGCNAKVLPLFYELDPDELKKPENLSQLWRPMWEKIKDGMYVDQWEKALKTLDSFSGLVFKKGSSEAAYIQEVVHRICDFVGYSVPYDLSFIQGHERFAKEIASMFELVKAQHGKEPPCMVGVHGVGGLGKTTLCKSMVNFYTTQYHGRSSLIEFPSDGDKSKIVQECKRALEKITSFRNERVLHEIKDFDQVVHLMAERVKRYDLFLAIDNVWESCRVEAERLLGVGFSGSSKILLTSRSEQVLREVLIEHTNTSCVMPLPVPENEEAFQIFQRTFKLGKLRSLVDSNQIDGVLERCKFSGSFHALALEAFGQRLKQVCLLGGLKKVKTHLSLILEDMRDSGMESLEDVIKLNYDILPEHKKHMFLDVAVSFRQKALSFWYLEVLGQFTCAQACKWLGWLYKKFAGSKISSLLYELASDGLIQIGPEDEDGDRRIGVHDLYIELAEREVAKSSRFFMDGSMSISVEQVMEWERLERAIVRRDAGARFFQRLEQQGCRKLQVLRAQDTYIERGICVNFMPSLCVLSLVSVNWEWKDDGVVNLNGLVQLRVLWLAECNLVEITGLDALQNLQRLNIYRCPWLKNLDGWSSSIPLLQYVNIDECDSLKKMPDLSRLAGLQILNLWDNYGMEEVGGEYLSPTLLRLSIHNCTRPRRFPSFKDCLNLRTLALVNCGDWSSKQWEHLPHLEDLDIVECGYIVGKLEVGCLSSLTHLHVSNCDAVEEIGDVSALHCLESLELWECPRLKKMGGLFGISTPEHLPLLTRLRHLEIAECGGIVGKLEVGCLTSLTYLSVSECEAVEEIGDVSALHDLEELDVSVCPRLKKVGGLVGISTQLTRLTLEECPSLEASSIPDKAHLMHLGVKCSF